MAETHLQLKGQVVIVPPNGDDLAFADGTNSGMFASVEDNGVGDSTVTVDDEFRINERDIFIPTVEGDLRATCVVERISETQVRLRVEDEEGPVYRRVALSCWTNFIG